MKMQKCVMVLSKGVCYTELNAWTHTAVRMEQVKKKNMISTVLKKKKKKKPQENILAIKIFLCVVIMDT